MKITTNPTRLLAVAGTLAAFAAMPAGALASSSPSMHHSMKRYCTSHQVMSHHTSHCVMRHSMKHTK